MKRAKLQELSPTQWVEMIDLVCGPTSGMWPGSTRAWTTADQPDSGIYEKFRPFPVDVVRSAIHALFETGLQNAPAPSKVLAKTKEIAASRYGELAAAFQGPCPHTNTGVTMDILTEKVVVFCSIGELNGCGWEEQTSFESLADYHAHYDRLDAEAIADAQPDVY